MSFWDEIRAALSLAPSTITNGIANFHEVVEGKVYRGGQPSRDGWKMLTHLGIKTIVKFNYPEEGLDDAPGFAIFDCRMPPRDFWQAIGKPDLADILRAVDYVMDERNWPVYGHCLHGQDRTGVIFGVFRVLKQGWTTDAAYAEMIMRGFHPDLHDVHEAWEDFVAKRAEA